jgi:hypothetical protein
MTDPLNLAEKIAAARVKLGSLKPDKTNKDQNYMYISADKILERAGDVLSEAGITIVPTVVDTALTNVERPNKTPRIDAVLKMSFQVTDGLTDYIAFWVGCGSDYVTPDKAIYKAITSGHKYFLMKLLQVGVGNEDSEHENPEPEQKQTRQPAPVVSGPEEPAGADYDFPVGTAYVATEEPLPLRFAPDTLRKHINALAIQYSASPFNEKQDGLLVSMLNKCFDNDDGDRHAIAFFLTGKQSIKEMTKGEKYALLKWLEPAKDAAEHYQPNAESKREANAALVAAMKDAGQQELI